MSRAALSSGFPSRETPAPPRPHEAHTYRCAGGGQVVRPTAALRARGHGDGMLLWEPARSLPRCRPVLHDPLWHGSWGVVCLLTRTSSGSGALLLFDQCAPRHRL